MRYVYPIELDEADDGVTVTAPDVPEMITCGSTTEEAVARAPDALVSALSFYVDEGRPIPRPRINSGSGITLPALVAAKLALHEAMLELAVSDAELGRRLGLAEPSVQKLRDLMSRSHIEQVESALRSLGLQTTLEVSAIGAAS